VCDFVSRVVQEECLVVLVAEVLLAEAAVLSQHCAGDEIAVVHRRRSLVLFHPLDAVLHLRETQRLSVVRLLGARKIVQQ
jgi:hypothetical protein